MTLDRVVLHSPLFSLVADFIEIAQPMSIEQLRSDLRVQALDQRVLSRLAWLDEVQLDSVGMRPLIHLPTAELRPVVGAQDSGQAALGLESI